MKENMTSTNQSNPYSLEDIDRLMEQMQRIAPPSKDLLNVRHALSSVVHSDVNEIMTLQEVADYLRLSSQDLDKILPELPAPLNPYP